jgi:hypothetical protein
MPPRTPLVRPKTYFTARDSALHVAIGVFLLSATVNAAVLYLVGQTILGEVEYLTPGTRWRLRRSFVLFAVGSVAVALSQVLVVATAMRGRGDMDRTESFKSTVAVAAWAYVPFTVESLVRYLRARREIRETNLSNAGTAQIETQFTELVFGESVWLTVVIALTVSWMVYVLADGTAGVLGLDREQTLGPAVGLGIALFVLKLLL